MRTRRLVLPVLLVCGIVAAACQGSVAKEPSSGVAPANRAAAGVAVTGGSAAPRAAAAATFTDWPAYHASSYRFGYSAAMPTVSGAPRVTHKLTLDGAVYASPIVIGGVTIVATENDTVYAFDSAYRQIWKRHLGTPSPASERPCGNIDPLGITGTPVYDSTHKSIFVAPEYSGNPPTHEMVSLSLATGATNWRHSLDLPGVDQRVMQERGALTLAGGRVWVPFGGLAGDCGNYKGRIIGLSTGTGTSVASYTVPTAKKGGIWTPPGITADVNGNMFTAVGNGAAGVGDPYDFSDSINRHSASTGARLDFFAPSNWAAENDGDVDLGSQGPTIVKQWIFSAGKSGTAYVLSRSHLGGIGGQVSSAALCRSFGGTAVRDSRVFVPCDQGGVRGIEITSAGTIRPLWHTANNITGSPVVGGGRVWALDPGAGELYALGGTTGTVHEHVFVGVTSRFATPALYGRNVLVPTLTGITVVTTS
jgi:hypothetical protein